MNKEKAIEVVSESTFLFIAWGASTLGIFYFAGEVLNYGAIMMMFVNPLNWIIHSVIRSKNKPYVQWKAFVIYLASFHTLILIVGVFIEEEWLLWAFELTWRVGIVYAVMAAQFLVIEYAFLKIKAYW